MRSGSGLFVTAFHQLRPEGRNRRGETQLRVQRFWGPLGASEFDPSFQRFGVSETPSQRPLRASERLSGPRGRLFRGLGEGCPFPTERVNKVGHSEASKRPRFPGCPLRGFQPSGSYPQATDNFSSPQARGWMRLHTGNLALPWQSCTVYTETEKEQTAAVIYLFQLTFSPSVSEIVFQLPGITSENPEAGVHLSLKRCHCGILCLGNQ